MGAVGGRDDTIFVRRESSERGLFWLDKPRAAAAAVAADARDVGLVLPSVANPSGAFFAATTRVADLWYVVPLATLDWSLCPLAIVPDWSVSLFVVDDWVDRMPPPLAIWAWSAAAVDEDRRLELVQELLNGAS